MQDVEVGDYVAARGELHMQMNTMQMTNFCKGARPDQIHRRTAMV